MVTQRPVVESVHAVVDRLYWIPLSDGLSSMSLAHRVCMWEWFVIYRPMGYCGVWQCYSVNRVVWLVWNNYKHNDYVYKPQCHVYHQAREQSNSAVSGQSRCRRLQGVLGTCCHATRRDGCQVTSLRQLSLLQVTSESHVPLHHKHVKRSQTVISKRSAVINLRTVSMLVTWKKDAYVYQLCVCHNEPNEVHFSGDLGLDTAKQITDL